MELIRQLNKYFEKNDIDKIDSALEHYIAEKGYKRHKQGKHELAKLCDELKARIQCPGRGYIAYSYISSDANDMRTRQPFLC